MKYEYLLDPSFKRLIENQVFRGQTNKDFMKLILIPENPTLHKDNLSFTLNVEFIITWILPLDFEKLVPEDKERKYMVAPSLDVYAFPESIEEFFYDDKKKKQDIGLHQVLLFNLVK